MSVCQPGSRSPRSNMSSGPVVVVPPTAATPGTRGRCDASTRSARALGEPDQEASVRGGEPGGKLRLEPRALLADGGGDQPLVLTAVPRRARRLDRRPAGRARLES